jgi:hypothetical protein
MTQNKIPLAIGQGVQAPQPGIAVSPSWYARLSATVFAGRYDRQVEECLPVQPGSALDVHTTRLTASAERERLARTLRSALQDGKTPRPGVVSARIPVHRAAITAVEDVVDDVTLRLHAPLPVRARGMARLRLLLADGAGPLYRAGRGSLAAELRGVLAAL